MLLSGKRALMIRDKHGKMMIDQCFQADSRLSFSQRRLPPASLAAQICIRFPARAPQHSLSRGLFLDDFPA